MNREVRAMVAGVFLLENIAAQAPSPVPGGAQLAGAIAWQGIAYGILSGQSEMFWCSAGCEALAFPKHLGLTTLTACS
ncbi:MAG TPA: hypothetical protein VK465_11305 [Fibrobacteria bacterium]|nr:hypothetical protein [Fibrobacteria bacterium]